VCETCGCIDEINSKETFQCMGNTDTNTKHSINTEVKSHGLYGSSFSFILVYLCICNMFGSCIWIGHVMERFFGIDFVHASTRFTQETFQCMGNTDTNTKHSINTEVN
jgi:hypothetical protein